VVSPAPPTPTGRRTTRNDAAASRARRRARFGGAPRDSAPSRTLGLKRRQKAWTAHRSVCIGAWRSWSTQKPTMLRRVTRPADRYRRRYLRHDAASWRPLRTMSSGEH